MHWEILYTGTNLRRQRSNNSFTPQIENCKIKEITKTHKKTLNDAVLLCRWLCMNYQINKRKMVSEETSLQFVNVSVTLSAYQELSKARLALRSLLAFYDIFNSF